MSERTAEPARYWTKRDGRVVCLACPRECTLSEGQHGFCYVRKNEGGSLVSLAYGQPNAVAVDPIEKKPLFHFLPGTSILSIGTAGCNLGCQFCQNSDLSKARSTQLRSMALPPSSVPLLAEEEGAMSVAFTYNDPTVFVEYAIDSAIACHEQGLATVAVTAGYISGQAREDLFAHIDAANIDLKGFTERFYTHRALAHLEPVLETIEYALKHRVWVELTTLVIPGENDSDEELAAEARWIVSKLGRDVPLHVTAFHPAYRMLETPATPKETLQRARKLALGEGLRFVYTGNVVDPDGETTRCPGCGTAVIERSWHAMTRNDLAGTGRCPRCAQAIAGVFDARSARYSTGSRHSLL